MTELSINDLDWLVHGKWMTLHHATLTPEQESELENYASLTGDITFDCGRTVAAVQIPGMFTRMGRKRCDRCCDRNGLPRGIGSPKNDAACRAILGLPPSRRTLASLTTGEQP